MINSFFANWPDEITLTAFIEKSSGLDDRAVKPKIIINLIAETNVDLCEKKKKHCLKVNFEIVKNIVNSVIKLKYNIFFLQISSDQVYSGKGPHDEKKIKPLNQYSLSKKYSEKWSSKINSCILRTNFFGFSKYKNKVTFTDWIYRSLKIMYVSRLAYQ